MQISSCEKSKFQGKHLFPAEANSEKYLSKVRKKHLCQILRVLSYCDLLVNFPKNLDLTLPHFFIASIPKKSSQTIFFSYVVWLVRLERCVWCSYPLDPPAKKSLSLLLCCSVGRQPFPSFRLHQQKTKKVDPVLLFHFRTFFFTRSPDA